MKKVLLSLFTIAVVGSLIGTGVFAVFSDTETSGQNVFTTGTVDIEIDGENPWVGVYTLEDMKPCETGFLSFNVTNIGTNKVALFKRIYNITTDGGDAVYPEGDPVASSEPEWQAGGGETGYTEQSNIQAYIDYDMTVFDYDETGAFLGERVIYPDDTGYMPTIQEIRNQQIFIGLLPPGCTLGVVQSYHLQDVGNWAQGDRMYFYIEIYAQQLDSHLRMENKDADGWQIETDDTWGRLMYMEEWPEFVYEFDGYGLDADTEYSLIYYADPWAGNNPGALIATGTSDGSGELELMGSIDLGMDLPDPADGNYPDGAKIWLVPSEDYDEATNSLIDWDPTRYLYETQLITYDDTDYP